MTARNRIVVGVDGSKSSRDALDWAMEEAAAWDAQLDVVHAWQIPVMAAPAPLTPLPIDIDQLRAGAKDLAKKEIDEALSRAERRPPRVERITVQSSAASALLEASKGADLLVVGSRGHGGFVGLLLGSVSTQCVHHATCPVVVVRGGER